MHNSYRNFISKALGSAAQISLRNFGKVSGTIKGADSNQVLTETDLEIGRFLIHRINEAFPDHNIIDEESGVVDNGSEWTWVIDPIDGTSNFAQGVPLYGTMIGLLHKDAPIAGGVSLPSLSEVYVATRGKGTWCANERMRVSDENDLLRALVAYGIDGHREDAEFTRRECDLLADIVLNVRNLRSSNSVFDAAMVVRGRYGAWLNRSSKIWDNVAQQILIEEAGGAYTDFFGSPIDYSNHLRRADQNYTFCAAPPSLHRQLQAIIRRTADTP